MSWNDYQWYKYDMRWDYQVAYYIKSLERQLNDFAFVLKYINDTYFKNIRR